MMLPPPITTATWTPSSRTFLISSTRYFGYWGEIPNLRSPSSASPESLSTTRPYWACAWRAFGGSLGRLAFRQAQLEPLEPPNADVLSRCGSDAGNELADGLRRVADVGLLEEALQVFRIHRRDLHRYLLRELAEVRVARDEVGLARELDHRADPAARVHVCLDHALLGLAVGLLLGLRQATLLDQALRFREVALCLVERSLAVHHASARLLAEALDVVLCVRHHSSSFLSTTASASSAGSS